MSTCMIRRVTFTMGSGAPSGYEIVTPDGEPLDPGTGLWASYQLAEKEAARRKLSIIHPPESAG